MLTYVVFSSRDFCEAHAGSSVSRQHVQDRRGRKIRRYGTYGITKKLFHIFNKTVSAICSLFTLNLTLISLLLHSLCSTIFTLLLFVLLYFTSLNFTFSYFRNDTRESVSLLHPHVSSEQSIFLDGESSFFFHQVRTSFFNNISKSFFSFLF